MPRRVALFDGPPMTCLERLESMLVQYVAAALVLGAKPALTPAQVIQALVMTATDVAAGFCHPRFSNPAGPGFDIATGAGLVNAAAAVQYAVNNF